MLTATDHHLLKLHIYKSLIFMYLRKLNFQRPVANMFTTDYELNCTYLYMYWVQCTHNKYTCTLITDNPWHSSCT